MAVRRRRSTRVGRPLVKPEPRKRRKAREDRREAKVERLVRERVIARDGYCRLPATVFGEHDGPSEWAHLGDWKRYRTVGRAPEDRHSTAGSLCLCRRHHTLYDRGAGDARIYIDVDDVTCGADGNVIVSQGVTTAVVSPPVWPE